MIHRYFLFLLVNVVFIFLLASTYWQLVRDLANSPAKIPEKLAQALQIGRARSGDSETSRMPALIYCEQALFPLLRDFTRWVIYPPLYVLGRNASLLGFGIMPLQLLNLGIIIPRVFYRLLITRTPRGKRSIVYMPHLPKRCWHRFCRAERTSCHQLRHRISPGNPDICDNSPI